MFNDRLDFRLNILFQENNNMTALRQAKQKTYTKKSCTFNSRLLVLFHRQSYRKHEKKESRTSFLQNEYLFDLFHSIFYNKRENIKQSRENKF